MAKRRQEEVEATEREQEGLSELTGDPISVKATHRVRVPHLRTGMPDFDVPGEVAEPMSPPRPNEPGRVTRRQGGADDSQNRAD
jgi:hypothetical protein